MDRCLNVRLHVREEHVPNLSSVIRACWFASLSWGCLDRNVPLAANDAISSFSGDWIFHIDGGRFADHVQVVRISATSDPTSPLRLTPLSAKDWLGVSNKDLACVVCGGDLSPSGVEWNLILEHGDSVV